MKMPHTMLLALMTVTATPVLAQPASPEPVLSLPKG